MISMTLPMESMAKLNTLSTENMNIVIQVIDQLSEKPADTFRRLRTQGLQNPMSEEEIEEFVASVRNERYAHSS